MPKKAKKRVKTATVRLYRASSEAPVRIGNSAKEALSKMKKALQASDRAIVRIDARFDDSSDKASLDIYFDDVLDRQDMVYLSNKILFVMNQESAVRLTGGTLECDHLGFFIDSTYFNEMVNLDTKDIPKC